jgi:pyruvate-ferredoxin/flavodoxin oxidoreductase
VKSIAVLDRTKEPGAMGEPLYLDIVNALVEGQRSNQSHRWTLWLSSKEFTPAMDKAVFG